ncbi:unnamed protein product [Eruca vesicaria subsp. sativa]|uniref:Uncharacterized protein n=1 Tax=Eruca vesicaria subsp. sativa TaxID=29727 RepID=A0ABC8JND9_ERUVS|nr:unnamed protein product [Eruca vesicaria subsp. sativa]
MNPLNQGSSSSAPPVANDLVVVEKTERDHPNTDDNQWILCVEPLNQIPPSSSHPVVANDVVEKKKRGRPRKEKSQRVTTNTDVDLIGQTVYGVVERSIDAGYILNVKVKDSDTNLRGVVFLKGKVAPVTPENDVAPHVKMYSKEDNNQTGHPHSDQTPNDQPMTDDVTDVEISESAGEKALVIYQSKGVEEEAGPSS